MGGQSSRSTNWIKSVVEKIVRGGEEVQSDEAGFVVYNMSGEWRVDCI